MKRISFFVIAMLFAAVSFAQNMNVQTAYNHLKKDKLKEALESIQPALENSQTSGQAKTWFYYGNICFEISNDTTKKYADVLANPIDEAVRGYTKASELDKRGEYKEDIQRMMAGISAMYSNKAITAFENKSYQEAANDFIKAYDVRAGLGKIDTSMLRYAGICWVDAKEWDKVEEIFTQLKDMNYNDPVVYISLAKAAVAKNDLNKAVAYLKEGEAKFPTDLYMLTEKANMYMVGALSEMNKDEAVNTLKKLIAIEPDNPSVWNSLGACYALDSTKFDDAVAAYKKCIELKPDFTNAYYGLSNLYLDKANRYIKEAQDLPLSEQDKYKALSDKAEATFKEVLPYIEKAYELDSSDTYVKQILKEIYTRLNMTDKAAGVK